MTGSGGSIQHAGLSRITDDAEYGIIRRCLSSGPPKAARMMT
jgi:hypothetical protein